jgi:hypothetical protein
VQITPFLFGIADLRLKGDRVLCGKALGLKEVDDFGIKVNKVVSNGNEGQ